MDDIARYNRQRWQALAAANAIFTRPWLDLDAATAREVIDPEGRLGELRGKQVLCLAGGGGQQSAAFALLGAQVTVLDLADAQLQRDHDAARHYGTQVTTVQGDMRDLSPFGPATFDVVWQPYSLNFVPDAPRVFQQVARVLRVGGVYHFHCANPFLMGLRVQDWNGVGYPLRLPYVDGAEVTYPDEAWVFRGKMPKESIRHVREYRHTLSALLNGLVEQGFALLHVIEEHLGAPDPAAEPGSDEHFTAVAPPWLKVWAAYRPTAPP